MSQGLHWLLVLCNVVSQGALRRQQNVAISAKGPITGKTVTNTFISIQNIQILFWTIYKQISRLLKSIQQKGKT